MFLKKIILFFVSILIGLTNIMSVSANGDESAFLKYKNADDKLQRMEIIINTYDIEGYFRDKYDEANLTRDVFVVVATRILSTMEPVQSVENVFTDDNWSKDYLIAAYKLGLINGYPDSTFRPEDKIMEYDAVVILIRALGYEEATIENGGYPTGYFKTAEALGLLKNTKITADANNQLKYGEYFLLLINAMETKMHGKEDWYLWDEYSKNNNYTKVIAKALEIIKEKSNVNDELVDYLKVTIDGKEEKILLFNEYDLSDFLGKNVILWYSGDLSENKFLIDIILP